jgi:diguanylate cyclase (GGDEF)-like protein
VGVLTLYSTPSNAFSEEHQRVIEIVARQVSSVIQQGAATDWLGSSAGRDRTTGLPHFREFSDAALVHIADATLDRPVSLLLIDVDNLARINQQYGRNAGDDVLLQIVKEARKGLRTGDLLFRHRNDELIALLLQTDEDAGWFIGERVQRSVQAAQHAVDPQRRFAISISVASAPKDGRTLDELLAVAGTRQRSSRPTEDPQSPPGDRSTRIH